MLMKRNLLRAKLAEAGSIEEGTLFRGAFWTLAGQLSYLADTQGMKGHELNRYAKHVLKRIQDIDKEIKEAE